MTRATRLMQLHPNPPLPSPACSFRARDRRRRLRLILTSLALLAVICGRAGQPACGQDPTTATAPGAAQPAAVPKVVSARSNQNPPDRVQLQDVIFVKVTHLDALLKQNPLKLYLNGRPAPLAEPLVYPEREELGFLIESTGSAADQEYWYRLLQPVTFTRDVSVSVGPAEGAIATEKDAVTMTLVVIPTASFCIWLIMSLFLVIMMVFLAKKTKMLRDAGQPNDPSQAWNRYSLSRTQMAFWFVLIVSSFGFIWLITGNVNTLTASVVALAGISAATALGAVTVDAGKEAAASEELANSRQAQQAIQDYSAAAPPAVAGAAADPAAMQQTIERNVKLKTLAGKMASLHKQATVPACENFWKDILSDANGVSLYRLQIAVWTIVLGIIFVHDVWNRLAMPEFSSTLLSLMGVSSGTYIGFKFPERKQQ